MPCAPQALSSKTIPPFDGIRLQAAKPLLRLGELQQV